MKSQSREINSSGNLIPRFHPGPDPPHPSRKQDEVAMRCWLQNTCLPLTVCSPFAIHLYKQSQGFLQRDQKRKLKTQKVGRLLSFLFLDHGQSNERIFFLENRGGQNKEKSTKVHEQKQLFQVLGPLGNCRYKHSAGPASTEVAATVVFYLDISQRQCPRRLVDCH